METKMRWGKTTQTYELRSRPNIWLKIKSTTSLPIIAIPIGQNRHSQPAHQLNTRRRGRRSGTPRSGRTRRTSCPRPPHTLSPSSPPPPCNCTRIPQYCTHVFPPRALHHWSSLASHWRHARLLGSCNYIKLSIPQLHFPSPNFGACPWVCRRH
jgi:hypothetical protein